MNKYTRDAQRIRHKTSVLACGASKAVERVAAHVIAARHRYALDCLSHIVHRNAQKAVGDILGCASTPNIIRQLGERYAHRFGVQSLLAAGPEDFGKKIRNEFAGHDIGIGYA